MMCPQNCLGLGTALWLSRRADSFREAHVPGSGWSHHPVPGDSSLCSQPGSGLSPLLSRWPQVATPHGGHESHHSRVGIQQCMCIPCQACCLSPPLQHSTPATGFGGRRGLSQPCSGTAAWGTTAQRQKQVWGGSGRDVNRPHNIPWGWRQCRQPGLELSQCCPGPGAPWQGHRDVLEDTESSMAGAVPTDLIDGLL